MQRIGFDAGLQRVVARDRQRCLMRGCCQARWVRLCHHPQPGLTDEVPDLEQERFESGTLMPSFVDAGGVKRFAQRVPQLQRRLFLVDGPTKPVLHPAHHAVLQAVASRA